MHPTALTATRRYVAGPSGQIHVYDTGGEGIPLVLLHQAPQSSLDFATTFPAFATAGQRLLAIDSPGHGMSDATPEPATIIDYANAVLAVLDGLGIKRAHLLGHHTGVKVAIELAAAHPDRVGKLVLYGAALSSLEAQRAMWEQLVPHEQAGRVHKPEAGGAHLAAQFQRGEGYAGLAVAQNSILSALMAGPKWWYGHNAALTHDIKPALSAVKAPMLFLTHPGEMLDAQTRAMADHKAGSQLVALNTNCAMALDAAPDEFVAAVMAFLRAD